jgi:3-deoxy-D-manno-octulosonate 8-phosphate phosphatase KdsC-like HAD superfamily phosphatase
MVKGDIKLVVYDFDGVMTDNRVFVNQDGIESVVCNRGDGLGVSMVKGMLIPQIILSTETVWRQLNVDQLS